MNPINWSEASFAKKAFTVIVGVITIGVFEYVMLHDWATSPMLVKAVAVVFNAAIAAVVIKIATEKKGI